MAVNIGPSLREGSTRAFSRNGVLLIVAWAFIGAASLLAYNSWFAAIYANLPAGPMLIGPSVDVPPLYAGIATVLLYVVSFVFMAGALRTFVTDNTQTLPGRRFTHNLGWMPLNLIVGFIIFYLAPWVGVVLLGIAASVYGVFSLATAARVYVQLSTSQSPGPPTYCPIWRAGCPSTLFEPA